MASVGTLTVDLVANSASFNSNVEKAARNLNTQAARMNRSIAGIQSSYDRLANSARAASFILAGAALVPAIKKSLDYAASLGEVAQQLGVTTKDLQVYRAIATQVGVTQEEMDKGLAKLTVSIGQASLGAKKQNETFAALGISVRNAAGDVKTAGEIIPELANRLEAVKDPAQRAAIEIALFGRAGQKLDTILADGADGINAYAKRAEDLGMVLSDDLIMSADEASDRMAELNAQLSANIARAVAQNADSILGLANAIATLTVNAIKFISEYPRLSGALAGAAVGSRFGGIYGAGVGGALGYLGGNMAAKAGEDGNMNVGFRQRKLEAALREQQHFLKVEKTGGSLFNIRKSDDTAGTLSNATAEVRRQTQLLRQASAMSRAGGVPAPTGGVDLPDFLAGGGGKSGSGRSKVDRSAEEARRNAERFASELAGLNREFLSVQQDALADAVKIADIDRQIVEIEASRYAASVQSDVAAGDLTKAQAEQLIIKNDQIRLEKLLAIDLEEVQRTSEEFLDIQMAANDNQRDMLGALEGLATTSAERRNLQLKILDLDKAEEKLRLQHVIDMARIGKATSAEAKAAEDRMAQIDTLYGARQTSVIRGTQGPMEAYLDEINRTPAEMDEAFQQIKVNGLQAFNDGLVDAIVNFKSLGDVARSVIQQILSDLLRLQIQQAIIGPLTSLLGGVGGASPNASLMGSVSGAFAENPGIFASGGFVSGPGSSTSDSIPAMLSNGEYVIRAEAVRRIGIGALNRLNTGSHPRFAMGGFVGRLPAMSFARNDNAAPPVTININARMSQDEARQTGAQVARAWRAEMGRQVRMGG